MGRSEVELTDEQDRRLEQLARSLHISRTALIGQAVDLLLQLHAGTSATEAAWQRARDVVGCFRSGTRDVAREHDSYLAEAYETQRE